jgi:glucosamine--fructose-6-phosphate aminotransferase (isomerizing)
VLESVIARESHAVLQTLAGPEIGVASTKAFTTQLTVLAVLAIAAARARGKLTPEREAQLCAALIETPAKVTEIISQEDAIERVANAVVKARDVLFLGRGASYPIALEGALKLKEISYIHAEGYAAGEMKHGPIALIDENVPIVVMAPPDDVFDKTASNVEQVQARGGKLVLFSDARGIKRLGRGAAATMALPDIDPFAAPILYAIPAQLLAYRVAVMKGTDVDKPRNLAKAVTVE